MNRPTSTTPGADCWICAGGILDNDIYRKRDVFRARRNRWLPRGLNSHLFALMWRVDIIPEVEFQALRRPRR